ncbi:MAG TPA: phosphate ABC transporter substrate-binding protein PstS [Acidimicrobiales bacterium]|nr:phosphate ABC transporter substrate-binding protein PstS [Acidimicrobiales bacterium]
MSSGPRRARLLVASLVVMALLGAACSSDSDDEAGDTTDSSATETTEAQLSGTLNASGATFPQAFYEEVIAAYAEEQPGVTINYGGGGSGKGRQELQDMVVDFAGSDGLVKPEDVPKFKGGEFLYIPTIAAPITMSYNLADVSGLKLDAPVVARIFQREIKTWDDPAIKALNADAKLPSTAITVVHRSDSSGTTENFTKYLTAAAPDAWKLNSGSTVEWPADTQGGNGNSGVAQTVKSTSGAIGYVDLSDAKASQLQIADLKNKAGKFVKADVAGATAAVESVTPNADLSYNPLNADGDEAYPITAPTWILVYKNQVDKAKAAAFKSFVTFLLNDGQDLAPDIDYAPLPKTLREKALAQLDNIAQP